MEGCARARVCVCVCEVRGWQGTYHGNVGGELLDHASEGSPGVDPRAVRLHHGDEQRIQRVPGREKISNHTQ